jgi:signal transduction histidine kinase
MYNDTTYFLRLAMPSFEQVPNLDRLLALAHDIGSATAMEDLLQRLTSAASELTNSEGASLLELDETLNSLHFVAAPWLREQPLKDIAVPLDASIAGWVFSSNEPLVIQDAAKDSRHFKAVDQALDFTTTSLVAVPLKYQGNTIGVLEAVNKADNAHYTGDDVAILEILALYAAIVLWNSNLEKRIRSTRNEFAELDRLKSNFVAITSHELRTPLGLILGHATFLRETIGEEHREPMEIIIRNATRLKEIIESLTEVDNYEAGVARIRQRLISMPNIVKEVVSSFQDMAASKNITLQVDVCDEELPIEADGNKIVVALSNLVRNAITFTNEGGHVLVKVEPVTGHAQVSVSDDGIGIPAKDLPKVFERFFQVESHLTRRNTGMGLGLSVAKTMIELHGGRIWAESVEGEGSKFTFLLPIKPLQTKIPEQPFKS